jgi:hypothetical protein
MSCCKLTCDTNSARQACEKACASTANLHSNLQCLPTAWQLLVSSGTSRCCHLADSCFMTNAQPGCCYLTRMPAGTNQVLQADSA